MDVDALRDEATELLRALLRVDTSNPPGRETPAAGLLRDYLEANGVACEPVARDPERANLVARIPGSGVGPSLMLLGHTDVVPAQAGDWTHPPFAGVLDEAGYVWGRGACDMKNETATRAVAVAEIARRGVSLSGDLVFVAEADEEDGTNRVGMSWLVDERPDLASDYVLNEGAAERLLLELLAELRVALGDDVPYELDVLEPLSGGTLSPIESPLLDACRAFIQTHDPGAILLPTLCSGFTDSHYLRAAFGSVAYGFWPVRTTPYAIAAAGVHGNDERIHVEDLGYATMFHIELCRSVADLTPTLGRTPAAVCDRRRRPLLRRSCTSAVRLGLMVAVTRWRPRVWRERERALVALLNPTDAAADHSSPGGVRLIACRGWGSEHQAAPV